MQPTKRVVRVFNPKAKIDWKILKNGNTKLEVASDGSGAKIYYKENFAGIISPLAKCNTNLKIVDVSKTKINFSNDKIKSLSLEINNNEICYKLKQNCEAGASHNVVRTSSSVISEIPNCEAGASHNVVRTSSSVISEIPNCEAGASHNVVRPSASVISEILNCEAGASHNVVRTSSSVISEIPNCEAGASHNVVRTSSSVISEILNCEAGASHNVVRPSSSVISEIPNCEAGASHNVVRPSSSVISEIPNCEAGASHNVVRPSSSVNFKNFKDPFVYFWGDMVSLSKLDGVTGSMVRFSLC